MIYCSNCDDQVKPDESCDWLVNAEENVSVQYCPKCGKYLGVSD